MKSFGLKLRRVVMDLSWKELFTGLNGGIRFMSN